MIAAITHKSGHSGNCLGYDFGDMLKKDQIAELLCGHNLFLSPATLRKIAFVPKTPEERKLHKKQVHEISRRVGKCFDTVAAMADERVTTPFVEYIISFAAGEHITKEKKKAIVKEYLSEMGILSDDLMYVATEHKGTNCEHVHIFCCRVNMSTGKVYPINQDFVKSRKICKQLNKKYGLVEKVPGYKRDRTKSNAAYLSKVDLTALINRTLQQATTFQGLQVLLAEHKVNLETTPRGCVFSTVSPDGVLHHWSGSQLDKDLSLNKIKATLKERMRVYTVILKERFPVKKKENCMYIIHSRTDASLYCPGNSVEREKMRQFLKSKGLMVGLCKDLEEFYEVLAVENQYGNYRVGEMQREPDGKIIFVQEKVWGDRNRTEYRDAEKVNQEITAAERKRRALTDPHYFATVVADIFSKAKDKEDLDAQLKEFGVNYVYPCRINSSLYNIQLYLDNGRSVITHTFGEKLQLSILLGYCRVSEDFDIVEKPTGVSQPISRLLDPETLALVKKARGEVYCTGEMESRQPAMKPALKKKGMSF